MDMTMPDDNDDLTPELEPSDTQDPIQHVRSSGMRSLADTYHLHAELLDEQRGVLNHLKEQVDKLASSATDMNDQARKLEETVRQAEERIQTGQAPVDTKPRKRFGNEKGPGF
jgi:predicted  nucleic acid-binding Zn-ribbon protein